MSAAPAVAVPLASGGPAGARHRHRASFAGVEPAEEEAYRPSWHSARASTPFIAGQEQQPATALSPAPPGSEPPPPQLGVAAHRRSTTGVSFDLHGHSSSGPADPCGFRKCATFQVRHGPSINISDDDSDEERGPRAGRPKTPYGRAKELPEWLQPIPPLQPSISPRPDLRPFKNPGSDPLGKLPNGPTDQPVAPRSSGGRPRGLEKHASFAPSCVERPPRASYGGGSSNSSRAVTPYLYSRSLETAGARAVATAEAAATAVAAADGSSTRGAASTPAADTDIQGGRKLRKCATINTSATGALGGSSGMGSLATGAGAGAISLGLRCRASADGQMEYRAKTPYSRAADGTEVGAVSKRSADTSGGLTWDPPALPGKWQATSASKPTITVPGTVNSTSSRSTSSIDSSTMSSLGSTISSVASASSPGPRRSGGAKASRSRMGLDEESEEEQIRFADLNLDENGESVFTLALPLGAAGCTGYGRISGAGAAANGSRAGSRGCRASCSVLDDNTDWRWTAAAGAAAATPRPAAAPRPRFSDTGSAAGRAGASRAAADGAGFQLPFIHAVPGKELNAQVLKL